MLLDDYFLNIFAADCFASHSDIEQHSPRDTCRHTQTHIDNDDDDECVQTTQERPDGLSRV